MENLYLAKKAGYLLLVEGESDCHICWYAGIPALGSPGVAAWQREWSALIPEGVQIYIWQEPDEGHVLVEKVLRDFPDAKIIKTTVEEKDPRQVWLSSRDKADFVRRINELLQTATTADDLQGAARRTEREAAWQKCKDLATEPDILIHVLNTLSQVVAGEREALAVLYLALTSRLLPRPINLLLQAPPGAGKSYLVDRVLQMFPESAYYKLTASSERAFIYSDENFAHRTVVVAEAAGLHSDGVAGTIVRELIWGNKLAYEVVEKTPDGLRPRKIIKDGPVGLITTTVKNVEGELATRLLVVELKDTPEQTRLILEAEAREAAGQATMPDLSQFVALQKWLELNGPANVVVPYAETLAKLLKPSSVRVRRDFKQLLTLIMAYALLHQATRQVKDEGTIVATIEDYSNIYHIANNLFSSSSMEALTPAQNELVEAVRHHYASHSCSMTLRQLADALGIDKSAASRRLQAVLAKGYVRNLQDKPGQPAMLVPGDPPPDNNPVLPKPEELTLAFKNAGV
ncbi:LexA family protein [Neomoorella mulderi]|uniref:LexA family protein n=1 Tax=Neomoorella mulderi TaxID=202604 RepID=UPI001470E964|nr:helix-turn-helix domain-containing protein [Moorella mulderi]